MPKHKKNATSQKKDAIIPSKKSLAALSIDWANKYAPGPLANNMARFIGKFNYDNEKSELSKKKDACTQNKKVLKGVTGDWYDHPGSADVIGIDMPSTKVKEHKRRDPKTGKLKTIKTYYRSSKNFPRTCKKDG